MNIGQILQMHGLYVGQAKGGGGDGTGGYRLVEALPANALPSAYEEGLTMMRPTGAVAKSWWDITTKAPAFNENNNIMIILTNCVNGEVVEQYIQRRAYASSGQDRFEAQLQSVFLRNSNKRIVNPDNPALSWQGSVLIYPPPSAPSFRNPNAMWRKDTINESLKWDDYTSKWATIAYSATTTNLQSMNLNPLTGMMFTRSNTRASSGKDGTDLISLDIGYTYEATVDLNFAGSDFQKMAVRVDIYDDITAASNCVYDSPNNIYSKIYIFGSDGSTPEMPPGTIDQLSYQFVVPFIGSTLKDNHMVISAINATGYQHGDIQLTKGSITFKMLRRNDNFLGG